MAHPAKARTISVPFLDLGATHADLTTEITEAVAELFRASAFTNGPQVSSFEHSFATFCGAERCVGVASGLDALRLILQALEIGPGDEVIVPAHTFVATAEAVSQVGATPVLVDVTDGDYNMDVAAVASAIGHRTRAILPVHLYGQMADVVSLRRLANDGGIQLIEDACQAHGAERDGIRAGTAGSAAAFSFYPGKNLGAAGDAGAVVTDLPEVAERISALREHGQRAKYHHDYVGWTSRLDTIQAIVLEKKLPLVASWNAARKHAASTYMQRLAGVGDLVLPPIAKQSQPVWHLFVVRTAHPENLAEFLRGCGVATGRHYPIPIHLTTAYRTLGHTDGSFPVSEAIARECLSLPLYPEITERQIEHVSSSVEEYFHRG